MRGRGKDRFGSVRLVFVRWVVVAAVLLGWPVAAIGSAPGPPPAGGGPNLAPDWMSAGTAAALDLGFDVLVPPSVPAPFGGEPSVYAAPGYYSLYWVVYGGPPTFLEITGEVGGDIPDGSAYDLNVQLVVNAEVRGYPAYRDLTPVYDTVWWQAGDVVYSVSSRNLAGTDSLAVANGLTVLVPPAGGGSGDGGGDDGAAPAAPPPAVWAPAEVAAGQTVTVWVEGEGVALQADGGIFLETGTATYPNAGGLGVDWQAPAASSDVVVTFAVVDVATGDALAVAESLVRGTGAGREATGEGGPGPSTQAEVEDAAGATGEDASGDQEPADGGAAPGEVVLGCPPVVYSGRLAPVRLAAPGEVVVEAEQGGWPDEPGNRRFDETADGGPDLRGEVPVEGPFFIHWRAPQVQTIVEATFAARGPDGGELATCITVVRPGPPPLRGRQATVGDGTGGPRPNGPGPTAVGGGTPALGLSDGSGGPEPIASPAATDGTDPG